MDITEQTINLDNIKDIIDKYLKNNYGRDQPLLEPFKNMIYDIFNDTRDDKESKLKKIENEIDTMRDFLVELLYGEHDLQT